MDWSKVIQRGLLIMESLCMEKVVSGEVAESYSRSLME